MSSYAIYLRKSRADIEAEAKGEGETLARHHAQLMELARRRNLNITKIYKEIVPMILKIRESSDKVSVK